MYEPVTCAVRRACHAAAGAVMAVALAAAIQPVLAQDEAAPPVRLELNRLEPQGEACRIYLLIVNPSTDAYRSLKLDLFAFDLEGIIAKRVAIEVAPLPAKKTSVKLFDLTGLPCQNFSRVLLNDLLACDTTKGTNGDCLSLVETSSRVPNVTFDK